MGIHARERRVGGALPPAFLVPARPRGDEPGPGFDSPAGARRHGGGRPLPADALAAKGGSLRLEAAHPPVPAAASGAREPETAGPGESEPRRPRPSRQGLVRGALSLAVALM